MDTAIPKKNGLAGDQEIVYVPLNKLHRSKQNVRTIDLKDALDAELHASMLADGLFKNLIGVERDDGEYDIPAGGRRLASLQLHAKEGNIPADKLIPLKIQSEADSVAISLAENLTHKAMHPADACAAFLKLQKQGSSLESIAARFGYTVARVERNLRLAQLNATLLKHFRANRLTLDQAMAYCATPDRRLQLAVFRSLGDNTNATVHSIRRHIEDSRVRSDTGLAKFVGMDAYTDAGGLYWDDLFTGVKLLNDRSLLVSLADKKLEMAAEALEGWKWVDTDHEGISNRYSFERLPFVEDVPDDEKAKLDLLKDEFSKIRDELEALECGCDETVEADIVGRYEAKEAEIEALEQDHTERFRVYDNKQEGGCIVTYSHDTGRLFIFYGLQSKDDRKARSESQESAEDAEQKQQQKKASLAAVTNGKADGMNKKLLDDLGRYRREIIRAELLKNPVEARDLLEFHLCQNLLSSDQWVESPLCFRIEATVDKFSDEATEVHKAAETMIRYQRTLNLSWLRSNKPVKQYDQFRKLSANDREKLLCFVAASTLEAGTRLPGQAPLMDDLVSRLETDFRDYFTPSAESYFSRLRTDQLIALGKKLVGKSWVEDHQKSTKKQLVAYFDNLFRSSDDDLTVEMAKMKNEWIPPQIKK